MPASTDIYGSIQQVRPTNRLAELAQVMQVQGLQQQGEMGRLKMDEYRRDREQENALSAAYSSALGADGKIDRNKLLSAAASSGLGAKIPGIQKGFVEQDKASAESQKALLENTKKRVDLAGQAFGFVRSNPTLENANSAIDFLGTNGVWDAKQVAQYKAQVAADPTKIGALAEQAFRSALDAKEQLAKYETRNLGGTTDTVAIDPVTGQTRTVNSVQNTQSPDSVASTAIQRDRLEEDKRHHGVTEKNQAETLAQGKLTYDAERGGVVNLRTGEFKSATQGGAPMPAKVPESSKKEMASIDAQLSVLDGAIKDVQKAPSAFGMTRGLAQMGGAISESVAGRFDSAEERDARSYVFNVVSKVINERAGAAQSAQELARLRSFLPAETDNAEQITGKLESFKGYLADLRKGYGGTGGPAPAPAASPAAAPKGPQPGMVQDGYRFKGGNPADRNSWEKV